MNLLINGYRLNKASPPQQELRLLWHLSLLISHPEAPRPALHPCCAQWNALFAKQINDGGDLGMCGLQQKRLTVTVLVEVQGDLGSKNGIAIRKTPVEQESFGVLLGTIRSTHVIYLGVQHNHLVKQGPQECKDWAQVRSFCQDSVNHDSTRIYDRSNDWST